MLLGIPGDNTYSNYQEAQRAFWRSTVLPLVTRTAKALASWLAPAWETTGSKPSVYPERGRTRLELRPDLDQIEALSSEREALWARIEKVSFLTLNEKRQAVGYAPLEEAAPSASAPDGDAPVVVRNYRPDQARAPAGTSDGGQWVDEGGGGGNVASGVGAPARDDRSRDEYVRVAQAEESEKGPVDLRVEDNRLGGHTTTRHVARPDDVSLDQTGADLLEAWYGYLLVSGNAYLEAVALDGRLCELHALRPDRMKVVPGAEGWPEAFEYTCAGRTVRFEEEPVPGVRPVLHVRLFHPANDHYGMSPVEAAAQAIDIHNTAGRWNKALLDNSARPSGALASWLAPAWETTGSKPSVYPERGQTRLELRPDLDQIEALTSEREALWARIEKVSFLTLNEKRQAVGYAPLEEQEPAETDANGAPMVVGKYNPNQPRAPRGVPEGGQWVDEGGGSGGLGSSIASGVGAPADDDEAREEYVRVAQAGSGRSAPHSPIRARFPEATPAQEVRWIVSNIQAQEAIARAQAVIPGYRPRDSLTSTIEGEIARN